MKLPRYVIFKKILAEIKGPIFSIIALITFGTYLLTQVEDFTPFEALYYLVVTVSTVGYGDLQVKTQEGQLVSIAVIVIGIAIISLSLSSIGNRVIQNMLNHDFRYEQAIKSYEDHIIVAGYTDIGRRIVQYLQGWRMTVVVIDIDEDMVEAAREDGHAAIRGDVSDPRELRKLHIYYAAGLVLAINDPNVTLFSAQAAKVANPGIWVIAEKNIHLSKNIYKSVQISEAVDRFSATKTKIRGILWGLEIDNFGFNMRDGVSFFQVPNLSGMSGDQFSAIGFTVLGSIHNNIFEKFNPKKGLEGADYLLIGGDSAQTKALVNSLKGHVPPDDDGVLRVILVGYGDYAETILQAIVSNSDEVIIVEEDEEKRKEAKKAGGSKVQVRSNASKDQYKQADIVLLTSRAAGNMLALGLHAKSLNPKVKLYARATMMEHTDIFEAAGADFVFSPEVDCAMQLTSFVINNIFNSQTIPFANGHLLFHEGNVNIKHVSHRDILAVYHEKKGKTEYFAKKPNKQVDQVLEFVTFRKQLDLLKKLNIERKF